MTYIYKLVSLESLSQTGDIRKDVKKLEEGINLIANEGWELDQIYSPQDDLHGDVFIFKKKIANREES